MAIGTYLVGAGMGLLMMWVIAYACDEKLESE